MAKLLIVIGSTRPGRVGLPVGTWFAEQAREHQGFEVEVADLKEVGLPLFDEPNHPRLGNYQHAHTKAWAARVRAADAFVFVTPEYNYGPPPSLINAIDYLSAEWAYKPVGFVSYGGQAGGVRAVQVCKQIVTTLKMMPMAEAVTIPLVAQHVGPDGVFAAQDAHRKAAQVMLTELGRWSKALATLR